MFIITFLQLKKYSRVLRLDFVTKQELNIRFSYSVFIAKLASLQSLAL